MPVSYFVVYGSGLDGNPTWNDVGSNLRFRTDDSNTQDSTNPLIKPTSGQNHSYWKSVAIRWEITAPSVQVSNIRLYCDGNLLWSYGTNGGLFVGDTPLTDSQYVQATGTVGVTGNEMVANHSNISSKTNIENYVVSSPFVVDTATYTTNTNSKHVVLQLTIDSDADVGLLPQENLYFIVDEL